MVPALLETCDIPNHLTGLHCVDLTHLDDASFGRLTAAIEERLHRRGKWLTDQTPGETRTFIGRQAELEAVFAMLGADTVAVAAVQGIGGIGKTMLVEELARRLRHRYPGGVIFETRGPTPPNVADVLHRWAGYALGQEPQQEMSPADVRAQLSRHGELLVVIDDVWPDDFAGVKTLLEAAPEKATRLLTTRFEEGASGIGAKLYSLERLTEADGLALLRDRLAGKGAPPPDELLKRLCDIVGGHALALELAAGRVKDTKRMKRQIDNLEARIQGGNISDVALNIPGLGKDASLAASLDMSFEALARLDKDLAARLPLLGVFADNAPFDARAAAAVWELDADLAETDLDRLAGFGLVTAAEGRFRQHLLVRACELGLLSQQAEKLAAARIRHANYYFAIADSVAETWQTIDQHAPNIEHAAEQRCRALGDDLIEALSQPDPPDVLPACDPNVAAYALQMAGEVMKYVDHRRVHRGFRWLRAGLSGARLSGNEDATRILLNEIAVWHRNRGQLQTALAYMKRCEIISQKTEDKQAVGVALSNIGLLYNNLGQMDRALEYLQRALPLHQETGNRSLEAATLSNIGTVYLAIGQPEEALEHFQRALPIFQETGDRNKEATALNNIGGVYRATGQPGQALAHFQRALSILQETGDRNLEAATLHNIGSVYQATGQPGQALEYFQHALPIAQETGNRNLEIATLNNISGVYRATGQPAQALAHLQHALPIAQETGSRNGEVSIRVNIAGLLHEHAELGEPGEDVKRLTESIELMETWKLEYTAGGSSINNLRQLLTQWREPGKTQE